MENSNDKDVMDVKRKIVINGFETAIGGFFMGLKGIFFISLWMMVAALFILSFGKAGAFFVVVSIKVFSLIISLVIVMIILLCIFVILSRKVIEMNKIREERRKQFIQEIKNEVLKGWQNKKK